VGLLVREGDEGEVDDEGPLDELPLRLGFHNVYLKGWENKKDKISKAGE